MAANRLTTEQAIEIHRRLELRQSGTETLSEVTAAIAAEVAFGVTDTNVRTVARAGGFAFRGDRAQAQVDVTTELATLATAIEALATTAGGIPLPVALLDKVRAIARQKPQRPGTLFDETV
jgi:Mg-chelatase subunit ChlD